MTIIKSSCHVFGMNKEYKPAATCVSGETVIFETLDCFCNNFTPIHTVWGKDNPKNSNPATGPLFIENCEVGDSLKIEILDIELGEIGIMVTGPVNLVYEDYLDEIKIHRLSVENDTVYVNDMFSLKARPMIGVIGVATQEPISTALLGRHGGNLDCNDITKGTNLYLPVYVKGGLLSIGDLHALMGDGEIGECGLEIDGRVTVKVTVIKNKMLTGPLLDMDDYIEIIEFGSTLEEASIKASQSMLRYMIEVLRFDKHEAALLLNLCGNLKVCQHVNTIKSVAMKMPKHYLLTKN